MDIWLMRNLFTKHFIGHGNLIPGISCMLLLCQAYLAATLQGVLSHEFNSTLLNMSIPAFIIPFAITGIATGFYRHTIKPHNCFLISLIALGAGTLLLSITTSAYFFLLVRILTGFGTGMMLPAAMVLVTRYADRRTALINMVIIIFASATGMTFGPSLGGWLNGELGWRTLYQAIALITAFLILFYIAGKKQVPAVKQSILNAMAGPGFIKKDASTYLFAYLTGVFHAGVFVWISYYFTTQYSLNEYQIANCLFIFGFPGLMIAIMMFCYRLDKRVIAILYSGLVLTIAGLLVLTTNIPLSLAQYLLALMSVGFSCSQPLFIGIIKIPAARHEPAIKPIALGCGMLFAGYGTGPIIMMALLHADMRLATVLPILLAILLIIVSRQIWKTPRRKWGYLTSYARRNKRPVNVQSI